jgi:hypothetical protein
MPAAPDLQTLLAYEAQILPAFLSILKAVGVNNADQPFNQPLDDEDKPVPKSTPFVDVFLRDIAPTEHKRPMADGSQMYDAWQGTLECRIYTVRGVDSTQQSSIAAGIRLAAQQSCSLFNNGELLPYHRVGLLKEAGGGPGIEPDQRLDFMAILFRIRFNIFPGAWPPAA